jgi:hypothetical protein
MKKMKHIAGNHLSCASLVSGTTYSDTEMLEPIAKINQLSPFAFLIVDTYGLIDVQGISR